MPDLESDRQKRFAIENYLGSGWLLLRDNVKVQRSFTATMERHPPTELRLELDIEVDKAGVPHARSVRLLADPESRTYEDSITTELWRKVNLTTLVKQAFRDALEPIRDLPSEDGERTFELDPDFSAKELDAIAPQGVPRKKSRKPMTDDELKLIAAAYAMAMDAGLNPTKLLADRFDVNRSTARRWAEKAEEKGFLTDRLTPAAGARRPRGKRDPD